MRLVKPLLVVVCFVALAGFLLDLYRKAESERAGLKYAEISAGLGLLKSCVFNPGTCDLLIPGHGLHHETCLVVQAEYSARELLDELEHDSDATAKRQLLGITLEELRDRQRELARLVVNRAGLVPAGQKIPCSVNFRGHIIPRPVPIDDKDLDFTPARQ